MAYLAECIKACYVSSQSCMTTPLLQQTVCGIYCERGDFYIDPVYQVERAIITHAHGDHARPGMGAYLTSSEGIGVLRSRLPTAARISGIPFGETRLFNDVSVSLHPAGHILGSAQVRVEHRGEVWVVSGDYKTEPDPTCSQFEPLKCHTFITESTFGLPIFVWRPQEELFQEIDQWWANNQEQKKASILLAYSLGKAQRVLAGLPNSERGKIFVHKTVARCNEAYLEQGIVLPETHLASDDFVNVPVVDRRRALIVAPPQVLKASWLKRFGKLSIAFCSGWMLLESERKKRRVQHGFPLSDHVDWNSLLETIKATEAERVGVMHGYVSEVVRYLKGEGKDAFSFEHDRSARASPQLDFSGIWS